MNPATSARRFWLLSLPIFLVTLPAAAQTQGPLPPPPPTGEAGAPAPAITNTAGRPATSPEGHSESEISSQPPALPVEEIIGKFSQHESEFRKERDNYTYSQTFVIQTVDYDGNPDGEYRMNSDILFTPDGKRYEKITYAPPDSLRRISMSKQDLDDLKNIQPFVLTTEDLPKYNVTYVGRQLVDELHTYVFDVAPKRMEKDQRYFQGRE